MGGESFNPAPSTPLPATLLLLLLLVLMGKDNGNGKLLAHEITQAQRERQLFPQTMAQRCAHCVTKIRLRNVSI